MSQTHLQSLDWRREVQKTHREGKEHAKSTQNPGTTAPLDNHISQGKFKIHKTELLIGLQKNWSELAKYH